MLKKMLMVLMLMSVAVFGRDPRTETVQKVTPEMEAQWEAKLSQIKHFTPAPPVNKANRQELGRTWYDYACNTNMGRMLARSANGIHFAFMKRVPASDSDRFVTYDWYSNADNLLFSNQSITEARATGWGRVVNGKDNEVLGVMHGGGVGYFQDIGEAQYGITETVLNPGLFPSIDRNGDTIVLTYDSDNTDAIGPDNMIYSTDYGASWTYVGLPTFSEPTTTSIIGDSELWPMINPANPNQLAYFFTEDSVGDNGTNSQAGFLLHRATEDFGGNWTEINVLSESEPLPGGQVYLVENFNQYTNLFTQDGTHHITANGFGILADDSDVFYPVIYWNSRDQEWKELTPMDISYPDTINTLSNARPGNGIGNAYPTLSEGPDGDLVAVWQQWEMDPFTQEVLTRIPAGGTETFMTDIWGAYSPDGGLNWSEPFYVAGTTNESDVYPYMPYTFTYGDTPDSIIIEVAYLWDTNGGTSLFDGGNDPSECIWYFERVAMVKPPLGIEDASTVTVKDFALAQNYPNPFNPSTTIEYNLQKSAEISLEIFNLVGQKVATLVNGRKAPGTHSVTFDAAQLSSGVYFYTLSSGSAKLTQKMLLLK